MFCWSRIEELLGVYRKYISQAPLTKKYPSLHVWAILKYIYLVGNKLILILLMKSVGNFKKQAVKKKNSNVL
jgi:hypothetical protein